jgi:hypothetical protein
MPVQLDAAVARKTTAEKTELSKLTFWASWPEGCLLCASADPPRSKSRLQRDHMSHPTPAAHRSNFASGGLRHLRDRLEAKQHKLSSP